MTISIDGIELNHNMVWLERYASQTVIQSIRQTLGGRAVIYSGAIGGGQPITLEAGEDHGWLTRAQVQALLERAQVPGAIYTLTFNGENIEVIFRHDEAPAVEFMPFVPREVDEEGDYMAGQIKLRRIDNGVSGGGN